jgi:hypothetical protein
MKNALTLLETLEQESLRIHPYLRTCAAGVAALAAAAGLLVVRSRWPILLWDDSPAGELDLGVSALTACLGTTALLLPTGVAAWINRSRLRTEVRAVRAAVRDASAPLAVRETAPMPAIHLMTGGRTGPLSSSAAQAIRAGQTGPLLAVPVRSGYTGPLSPARSGRTGPLGGAPMRSGQTGSLPPVTPPPPPPPGVRLRGLKQLSAVRAAENAATEAITLFLLAVPVMLGYLFLGGDIRLVLSVVLGMVCAAAIIAVRAFWQRRGFSIRVDDAGFRWRPTGRLLSVRTAWDEVQAVCRTTVNVGEDGSRQSIYVLDGPSGMLIWSIARPPASVSVSVSANTGPTRAIRTSRVASRPEPPPTQAATSGERLLRYALLCTGMPLRDLSKLIGAPSHPIHHTARTR